MSLYVQRTGKRVIKAAGDRGCRGPRLQEIMTKLPHRHPTPTGSSMPHGPPQSNRPKLNKKLSLSPPNRARCPAIGNPGLHYHRVPIGPDDSKSPITPHSKGTLLSHSMQNYEVTRRSRSRPPSSS